MYSIADQEAHSAIARKYTSKTKLKTTTSLHLHSAQSTETGLVHLGSGEYYLWRGQQTC